MEGFVNNAVGDIAARRTVIRRFSQGSVQRRAICFVARSVEYRGGIHSLPCASDLARRRSRQYRK